MTTCISDIVADIESNKNKMNDALDAVSEKSGVADAFQAGGRLYVQLHEGNDYLISAIEDRFDISAERVTPAGSKPGPDRARLKNKEAEFVNN